MSAATPPRLGSDPSCGRILPLDHEDRAQETTLSLAREVFQDSNLTLDSRLGDAGGYDSLAHVQFLIDMRDSTGVDLDGAGIERTSTVRDVAAMLSARTE